METIALEVIQRPFNCYLAIRKESLVISPNFPSKSSMLKWFNQLQKKTSQRLVLSNLHAFDWMA